MDTSEKIVLFESFDDLSKEIERDKESRDMLAQRYPIRFIMLNNFNELKRLAKLMVDNGVDILDLENLIDGEIDDSWITKDMLKEVIKKCEKSTFVTPFSEVVRFYSEDDFRGFFNEIMLLEDIHNPNKRIYIPLIGLQNRFSDFLNHFARLKESAPIWRYDSEKQEVEVFCAKYRQLNLPEDSKHCRLDSFKQWLMFWKKLAPQAKIVCLSKTIVSREKYSKPDNIFKFELIANAFEFLTKYLDLNIPSFLYDVEDDKFWEEFLSKLSSTELKGGFSFEKFVRSSFNKITLEVSDIIHLWAESSNTPYHRWLLKKYVQCAGVAEKNPYFALCINSTTNLSSGYQLINRISTRILYNDIPENEKYNYSDERRRIILDSKVDFANLLTHEDQNWLFERIKEVFQKQENFKFAVDLCTGLLDFEKKLFIAWSARESNDTYLSTTIEKFYPDYNDYLASIKPLSLKTGNHWVVDYIMAYKYSKIKNEYSASINDYIIQKNANESKFYNWYYGFENTHDVLSNCINSSEYKIDRIYWIDGLGIEFFSYINSLINHNEFGIEVIYSEITRSNLPSSTFHNRFVGDNVKKYRELDNLGHDSLGYKYPDTLISELKVLKRIIKEILSDCGKSKCTVAIVSDHGLSFLSSKAPSKKYEGKFEHEGRYIKTTKNALSDSDYIVRKNEEDGQYYKIALTHSSLSKVPTHQVHGGCTPEEVLVPFFILSNISKKEITCFEVKLHNNIIKLSNPIISVTVVPQPQKVILSCEGTVYEMQRDGTKWEVILDSIQEGEHTIKIQPEETEPKEFKIKVTGVVQIESIDREFDL